MTSEMLATTAAMLLSVLFEYVPGLSSWYDGQNEQYKKLIMLMLMIVVAGGAYGLSCAGQGDYFTCDQTGVWEALKLLALTVAANQGTHRLIKKPSP